MANKDLREKLREKVDKFFQEKLDAGDYRHSDEPTVEANFDSIQIQNIFESLLKETSDG